MGSGPWPGCGTERELTMEMKEKLEQHIASGGKLAPMPDGPLLEHIDLLELAQALESEVNRAGEHGHTKIRIDMDLADAAKLASLLRRAAIT